MTGAAVLRVRLATLADAAELLEWRNDEHTRAASRSVGQVSRDQHERWLAAVLADPRRKLYIIETTDGPVRSVGMCRFDSEDSGPTEVSINLNPAFRGRGLAAPVLSAAIEMFRARGGGELTATIRPGNHASIRAFERAGFRLSEATPEFSIYLG